MADEIKLPVNSLEKKSMHPESGAPASSGALRWVIYDLGHTGFTMIVMAVLFPILFQNFWAGSLPEHLKTSRYGLTLGIASVFVALMSPVLATIAQAGGLRTILFRILCSVGIVGTALLTFVEKDCWQWASLIYIVAAIGFFGANLFYDSLLIDVTTEKNRHAVSGVAFSVGYIGGVLLLGTIALWTQHWTVLGFETMPDPRWLFALGAVWWLVFALPLLFRKKKHVGPSNLSWRRSFRELGETCLAFWRTKNVRWFMLAYFCYIDGVHTIITSAVRYGNALGFSQGDLFIALFIVQVFGVPCALIFGVLGKFFGARPVLFVAIAIYIGVAFYGALMPVEPLMFFGKAISPMFVLAALIGMVQGGVQALSRSYFATIIPPGREVSFFGFYSMIGRCSTVLGPILLSAIAVLMHREDSPLYSTRAGIAGISLLFLLGAVFLAFAGTNARNRKPESAL